MRTRKRTRRQFILPNRAQLLLLANVNLDSIAPVGSVLRSLDELVDQLDTSEIEKGYDLESELGNEPIHPKTHIKVSLYALHNCRFSLRKIEEDTRNHLGYRWLTGNKQIDHSTIGKFLARYKKEILDLFTQTVMISTEQALVDFDVLAIDTVKIRANASYKKFKNQKQLEEEENKVRNKIGTVIEEVLNEEEALQSAEKKTLAKRAEKLEEAKEILKKRVEAKSEGKSKKEKEKIKNKEKINTTDFDCGLMQQGNGEINASYAITTATDSKNDIITHFQVNEENNDAEALIETVEGSSEKSGGGHKIVEADSGFSSISNLEKLKEMKQKALIPDRRKEAEDKNGLSKGNYDRSKFKYNKRKDEYKCPSGKRLGKIGEVKINGRMHNRYSNKEACKECLNKIDCTKSVFRTVTRDQNEEIKEKMRKQLDKSKNKILYKKRSHAAESPYGQIKHNIKYKIVMRRGREKIAMEMALLFMLHNMQKLRKTKLMKGY